MTLLQTQPGRPNSGLVLISLILRIIGVFVCWAKAKKLNRNANGWGVFGFISPVIAMIWVHCIKPKTYLGNR